MILLLLELHLILKYTSWLIGTKNQFAQIYFKSLFSSMMINKVYRLCIIILALNELKKTAFFSPAQIEAIPKKDKVINIFIS